jgi:murein DD-endopeptidase MepM/ murein hydrolase activator NlpD
MHQANSRILAQFLRRFVAQFRARIHPVVLLTALPFMGVFAAFGIAPDSSTDLPPVAKVVQEVALPVVEVTRHIDEAYWQEERIQRGDTFASLLTRLQVDDPEALQLLRGNANTRYLYQMIPGRTVRAKVTADGRLVALRYLAGANLLAVDRTGDTLSVSNRPAELEARTVMKTGEIRSSLFAAADAVDLGDAVAMQVADIFSTDIDFHRDLRKGDRFSVVYEVFYHLGEPVKSGRVLAAEFVNQGKTYRAVYFQNAAGEGGYYTADGRNIRKAFLRSPLEFSRITSGFTHARFHPILKQWRAHKGIDYGAPAGTRVRATADGVVEFAGRHQGGYGNLVVLRHQPKYTTWYGHLSGFASGIRRGGRVSQGDVIGYVGATGLATGPHLHYEFRINDVHQNPLRVAMPEAPPITPENHPAFAAVSEPLKLRLDLLRGTRLARLD